MGVHCERIRRFQIAESCIASASARRGQSTGEYRGLTVEDRGNQIKWKNITMSFSSRVVQHNEQEHRSAYPPKGKGAGDKPRAEKSTLGHLQRLPRNLLIDLHAHAHLLFFFFLPNALVYFQRRVSTIFQPLSFITHHGDLFAFTSRRDRRATCGGYFEIGNTGFELNLNPMSAYRIFSVLTPSATSSPPLLFAFVCILHLG